MGVQGMFPLTHWHSCALTSIQGMFSTHSLAFTRTHKCSGGVEYWLKGIHAHSQAFRACSILTQRHSCHSQAFRGCSVLTQMRTFSWSHHGESHSIMTQWHSCALNGCSHSLNCIHAHSMGIQGLFPLLQRHACALNGCSGAVPTHSLAFTCTCKHSGGVQYMFSLFMYLKAQWLCFQICEAHKGPTNLLSISVECHFFSFDKQEEWEIMTPHLNRWLVGGLGVCQWDWQQK